MIFDLIYDDYFLSFLPPPPNRRPNPVLNLPLSFDAPVCGKLDDEPLPVEEPAPIKLLKFLLGSQLIGVSALLLSAVHSTRWESSVALSANHLVNVVFSGKHLERRFNNSSSKAKYKVEGRLLLNIVVTQSSPVLKLLSSKDQTLLIGWNTLFILNFLLYILDCVRALYFESDSLSS